MAAEENESPKEEGLGELDESTHVDPHAGLDDVEGMPDEKPAAWIALEQEHAALQDRFLRLGAEFENWKKRAKREIDEAMFRGQEGLLRELLSGFDNLERALHHAAEDHPLTVGVKMVEKQFVAALERFGIERFSAIGQPFDPSFQDAIQHTETTEFPPGTVAQEFAKGYKLGGKLIRPAMVAVAKAPAGSAAAEDDGAAAAKEN